MLRGVPERNAEGTPPRRAQQHGRDLRPFGTMRPRSRVAVEDRQRGTNVIGQRMPGARLSRASAVRRLQSRSSANATYDAS